MASRPITAMPGAADRSGIDEALARIVASATFRCAPRLAAFLRFVVEMALAGRSDRIKGYTIGVEALGRAENFDPQSDTIVRVEAGRLRRALSRFYAGEGARDPVVIELPLGCYVPVFHARAASVPGAADDAAALAAVVERLIELRRLQVEAMAAEAEAARHLLELSRQLIGALGAEPCRTATPLLPTAPSASDEIASPAHGPKARKVQQAAAAPAARAR